MTSVEIVSEADLKEAFKGADFGGTDHRDILHAVGGADGCRW